MFIYKYNSYAKFICKDCFLDKLEYKSKFSYDFYTICSFIALPNSSLLILF